MNPAHLVESYRFWEVVTLWARERIEAPEVVARALAKGIICDGLPANSRDPKWISGRSPSFELKGYPYVGYAPTAQGKMSVLRIEALAHLLSVVREGATPSKEILEDEFINREHFKEWCKKADIRLPAFWYAESENEAA
jgi:hypothetical protein